MAAQITVGNKANNSMQRMLDTSADGLIAQKKQMDDSARQAQQTYDARTSIGISVKKASSNYDKMVVSQTQISKTFNRMTEMNNTLERQRQTTTKTKRMMLGIVEQFAQETGRTGRDIDDLQSKIETYVRDNSTEMLEMIQAERQFYHETLYSTQVRKGIAKTLEKVNIPINRASALSFSVASSFIGYILGRKL